jgi:hypothetical protein
LRPFARGLGEAVAGVDAGCGPGPVPAPVAARVLLRALTGTCNPRRLRPRACRRRLAAEGRAQAGLFLRGAGTWLPAPRQPPPVPARRFRRALATLGSDALPGPQRAPDAQARVATAETGIPVLLVRDPAAEGCIRHRAGRRHRATSTTHDTQVHGRARWPVARASRGRANPISGHVPADRSMVRPARLVPFILRLGGPSVPQPVAGSPRLEQRRQAPGFVQRPGTDRTTPAGSPGYGQTVLSKTRFALRKPGTLRDASCVLKRAGGIRQTVQRRAFGSAHARDGLPTAGRRAQQKRRARCPPFLPSGRDAVSPRWLVPSRHPRGSSAALHPRSPPPR